jgi:hypothetical protein
MSTLDLEGLKALLEKATEGPWSLDGSSGRDVVWGQHTIVAFGHGKNDIANTALIVAAVNAIPHLLADLDSARRENERLKAGLKPFAEHPSASTALQSGWSDPWLQFDDFRRARSLLRQPVEGDKP